MANREIHNDLHFVPLIVPVAARTNVNTAIVSNIIDTAGYNAVEFVLLNGALTDANMTMAVTVDEGDNSGLSDAAAIPAAQIVGSLALAGSTFADDNKCRKVGVLNTKRYVRLTVTPSGNDAGDIFIAGIAVLGYAAVAPTANPPQ